MKAAATRRQRRLNQSAYKTGKGPIARHLGPVCLIFAAWVDLFLFIVHLCLVTDALLHRFLCPLVTKWTANGIKCINSNRSPGFCKHFMCVTTAKSPSIDHLCHYEKLLWSVKGFNYTVFPVRSVFYILAQWCDTSPGLRGCGLNEALWSFREFANDWWRASHKKRKRKGKIGSYLQASGKFSLWCQK